MINTTGTSWEKLDEVVERISRRVAVKEFYLRAALALSISTVLFLLFSVIHMLFKFSPLTAKDILFCIIALLLGGFLVSMQFIIFGKSKKEIILAVEKCFPELKDRLACSYELSQKSYEDFEKNEFIYKAVWDNACACVYKIDFDNFIKPASIKKSIIAGVAAIFIGMWIALIFPDFLVTAGVGMLNTSVDYKVYPGNFKAEPGADVPVRLITYFPVKEDAVLKYRKKGNEKWSEILMTKKSPNLFLEKFYGAETDTEYFITFAGYTSKTYKIGVFLPPAIDRFVYKCTYPAYTELPQKSVEGIGPISELKGTEIEFKIAANKAVKKADCRTGEPGFTASSSGKNILMKFTIDRDSFYQIKLFDTEGMVSPVYKYDIKAVPDNPPAVEVISPKDKEIKKKQDKVEISASAEDDIKVKKTGIAYSKNGEAEIRVYAPFKKDEAGKNMFMFTLDLEKLNVDFGDLVSYYAFAYDNNPEQKEGRSDIYFLEIVDHKLELHEGHPHNAEIIVNLIKLQKKLIRSTWIAAHPAPDVKQDTKAVSAELAKKQADIKALTDKEANKIKTILIDEAGSLFNAVEQMTDAEKLLSAAKPVQALNPPEEKALFYLVKALKDAVKKISKKSFPNPNETEPEEVSEEDLKKLDDSLVDLKEETKAATEEEKKQEEKSLEKAAEKLKEILEKQTDLNQKAAQQEKNSSSQNAKAQAQQSSSSKDEKNGSTPKQDNKDLKAEQEKIKDKLEPKKADEPKIDKAMEDAVKDMKKAAEEYGKDDKAALKEGIKSGKNAEKNVKEALNAVNDKIQEKPADAEKLKDLNDKLADLLDEQKKLNEKAAARDKENTELAEKKGSSPEKKENERLKTGQDEIRKETEPVKAGDDEADKFIDTAVKEMKNAATGYAKEEKQGLKEGLKSGKEAEKNIKEALAQINDKLKDKAALAAALKDLQKKLEEIKKGLESLDKKEAKDPKKTEQEVKAKLEEAKLAKKDVGKQATSGTNVNIDFMPDLDTLFETAKIDFTKLSLMAGFAGNAIEKIKRSLVQLEFEDALKNIDRTKTPDAYRKLVDMYYEDLLKSKK